ERRDAGTAGDEGALALVLDGSPRVVNQQRVARLQVAELAGDAVMIRIDLDREFQMVPIAQAGKGEGPLFVATAVAVDRHFGGLARLEVEAGGPLELEAPDIVRDVLGVDDANPVCHAALLMWLTGAAGAG